MAESWSVGGLLAGLDLVGKLAAEEAGKAVEDIAQWVLAEATQQVPLEDGDLMHSGKVIVDEANRRAYVSFDTPYAVRQHEDMTYQHDSGRKAKYLEDPINAAARGPAKALIQRRLGGK